MLNADFMKTCTLSGRYLHWFKKSTFVNSYSWSSCFFLCHRAILLSAVLISWSGIPWVKEDAKEVMIQVCLHEPKDGDDPGVQPHPLIIQDITIPTLGPSSHHSEMNQQRQHKSTPIRELSPSLLPPSQISMMFYQLPFTFSHLADAFIQSDLQGCIHNFYIYTDGTLHIRSN